MKATTETLTKYMKLTGYFVDEIVGATEEELQEAIKEIINNEKISINTEN